MLCRLGCVLLGFVVVVLVLMPEWWGEPEVLDYMVSLPTTAEGRDSIPVTRTNVESSAAHNENTAPVSFQPSSIAHPSFLNRSSVVTGGNGRAVIPLLLTSLEYHGSTLLATTLEGWVKKFLIPQGNIDLVIFYDFQQVHLERLIRLLRLRSADAVATSSLHQDGEEDDGHLVLEKWIVGLSLGSEDRKLLGSGRFLTAFDDHLIVRVHPVVTPLPRSIQQNLTRLKDKTWMRCGCPPVCPEKRSSVDYIQGTRWYTYDLFLQPIVQPYSYWIKLDVDIWFFRPFPFNLVDEMKNKGAIFAHTGHIYNGFGCSNELHQAIQTYLSHKQIRAVSEGQAWWKQDDNVYYSNFVVSSMPFHLSAEHMDLAHYLNEYPTGFFKYRWTDQSLFHKVFGVFFGPREEDFSLDWTNLRWSKKFYRRGTVFYHSKGFKSHGVLKRKTDI